MSVISDIKMILESNNIHLLHDATSYLEQIERWDAIKDADLVERKHGEWIPHEIQVPWGDGTTDVTMFRCSVCGYEQDWQSKFCSNCGAKMDESEEKDG